MPLHGSFKRRKATPRPTVAVSSTAELARHLIGAQEEERKRISRELHDGTGQGLMVLRLYLAMLASESQTPESLLKIQEALKLLDNTVEDLRRIIGRLSPRTLEELGLVAAIRKEARDLSRNTGMKAQLDLSPDLDPINPEIEIAIYRSLQEALHNIAKHSEARNFTVHLTKADGSLCLLVEDDGVGFSRKRNSGGRTFGVLGMRERIAVLGGKVRIHSVKGKGTQIKVTLPQPGEPARQHASVEHRVRSRLNVHAPANPDRGQTAGRPRNVSVSGGAALPALR
jgi:two-component system sensor histidine kinase NreB